MSFGLRGMVWGTIVPAGVLGKDPNLQDFPGLHIFVAGKEYTGNYSPLTANIRDELGERNTMSFSLKGIEIADQVHFSTGEPVRVLLNGKVIFAGLVDNVSETVFGVDTRKQEIRVRCTDYNALADRHVVATRFNTPGQTLRDVVLSILNVNSGDINEQLGWQNPTTHVGGDGVQVMGDSVQTGPVLQSVSFPYKTVKEAFDEIAELTGYWWNIDYSKTLYFVDRTTFIAPQSLDDTIWNKYTNLIVKRARGNYRNVQVLRGGKDQTTPESVIEVFTGKGEDQNFRLRFDVVVPNVGGVDKPPKVEVDTGGGYVTKTVGIQQKDKNKDWYYEVGSRDITQDAAGTKLTSSHKLRVTYTGQFKIVVSGRADAEIARRAQTEQLTGVHTKVDEDEKIDDSDLAEEKVQSLLRRYAQIPDTITFDCFEEGFQSGQLLSVNLPEHGVQGQFLIDSVEMQHIGLSRGSEDDDQEEVYRYSVSATSGEFLGGWADFFRKQASKGRPFVLRENEVLLLLRQVFEHLDVTDFTTTAEPLGSYLDDKYSYLTVGGPWVGGTRVKSVSDSGVGLYYGPLVGFPLYADVS